MGTYLNPGNAGFERICKGKYRDKTGLIRLINDGIAGISNNLFCISRPRRFGKSYAAQMLCAYYDRSTDSHQLFADKEIAEDGSFTEHLNQYDVLYVDMTFIKQFTDNYRNIVSYLTSRITEELLAAYPDLPVSSEFPTTLIHAVEKSITGRKFIMIIDEWDAPIRETPAMAQEYLEFLRTLFKSSATTQRIFAAVYMTGILPIKKDGSQSAISDFDEFTMIKPYRFAPYVGFTESDVRELCTAYGADFSLMKKWYDGYSFKGTGSVYNPNSVMKAISNHDFDSYWIQSSAAESLMEYISQDYHGLTRTIAELISGMNVPVNTSGFANDLTTFKGKDDVLTLLIHLGYLSYDSDHKTVRIPNEEILLEFTKSIREVQHEATLTRLQESDQLFFDTIHEKEDAVAAQIEKIHSEENVSLHYNNEQTLRSTIKLAYYTYKEHYLQWEEVPAGDGIADIIYLPKKGDCWPVLVIELKWNKTETGAIQQIKDRHYPDVLHGFGGEALLVGINYNKEAPAGKRHHTCKIEKITL